MGSEQGKPEEELIIGRQKCVVLKIHARLLFFRFRPEHLVCMIRRYLRCEIELFGRCADVKPSAAARLLGTDTGIFVFRRIGQEDGRQLHTGVQINPDHLHIIDWWHAGMCLHGETRQMLDTNKKQ